MEGQRLIQEHWARGLDDAAREAAERTIDLDAEEATCPACLTPFQPGVTHCPGCGLRVG